MNNNRATVPDQVFVLRGDDGHPEWRVIVNGKVVAASWRDKGAALAGLVVEQRRAQNRKTFTPEQREEFDLRR